MPQGRVGLRESRRASLIAASRQDRLSEVVEIKERRDNRPALHGREYFKVCNIVFPQSKLIPTQTVSTECLEYVRPVGRQASIVYTTGSCERRRRLVEVTC